MLSLTVLIKNPSQNKSTNNKMKIPTKIPTGKLLLQCKYLLKLNLHIIYWYLYWPHHILIFLSWPWNFFSLTVIISTYNALKVLRQPRQKCWPKILISYFFKATCIWQFGILFLASTCSFLQLQGNRKYLFSAVLNITWATVDGSVTWFPSVW